MTSMLPPEPHQQKYQEFHQALLRLQGAARETAPNRAALLKEASALQQFFQEQILSLSVEELPPELMPWLQSYHTETHKQLRLLAADLSFWQAARQPGTIEQRSAQVRTRLETLISYSETVLG
ncbi:MAG TPA: heterocyst frequency control protein PatD [Oscillatoriaceae cyanobacterium M33_DOE_052]|nr:heterocyst frequency control protein PatD [Oscillatoriaceae cyanobacterium M33_DOE_052]